MEQSPIRLGMSTSVLNGYDPSWLSGGQQSGGLFTTAKIPLTVQQVETPTERGNWTYPIITLHHNADLLLNELFPAKINNPGTQVEEASFTAGALLTGDSDRTEALAKLSKTTGIDLSVSGRGYALVRLMRKDATQQHSSVKMGLVVHAHPVNPDAELGVNDEFRQAMSRLRPCLDATGVFHPAEMTVTIAGEYLDFFYGYGTHYVSSVDMGDCIFQIFAYEADKYARVKTAMSSPSNSFKEENAANFAYYTTSMQNGAYGYAAETGNIVAFSNNAALAKSLKAKQWQEPMWAKGNSIFAIFKSGAEIDRNTLGEMFTSSVPISYSLTTLTVFAETQRRAAWSRILAGAIVQKYPEGTKPNLQKHFRADNQVLFGSSNYSGFASAIATPNINVYKPRLNSTQLSFVAADTVENLVISTNLLTAADDTPDFSLPGKNVLLAAQSVSAETKNKTTIIHIPGKVGRNATVLYCNQFYGICTLQFAQTGRSQVIIDGLMLMTEEQAGSARGIVRVEGDVRVAPNAKNLPLLKQNIQFAYTFLQSSLHSNIAAQDIDLAGFLQNGMLWIVKQIPADTDDLDLLNIRLMALDLSRTPDMPYRGAYVPLLTSEKYEKQISSILSLLKDIYADYLHVQDMVEIRRTQELVINVGKTLNENIINSGQSLVKYLDTTANYQKSMSGYYDAIAQSQESQYKQMLGNIDTLTDAVDAQQKVVNTAIETYKNRLKTWATMKAISATFEIISGVFSAAGGGGGGGAAVKEVTELAKTIEKIKTIVKVLAAVGKAYQQGADAARQVRNANTALEGVDGAASLMLSQREWDEMLINLEAIMGGGPDDGSVGDAKRELLAAYKILMLRGKAMLDARGRANQMAWDLFNSQKLQSIAKEQANDLKKIKTQFTDLDPKKLDTSKIDLVGMTSSMDLLQNQMLTMMAKAFNIKDQALQYEYLQPSTPIRSFDLFGFQAAIVMQGENTLQADRERSQLQPGDTSDIHYRIEGIPVSELINGDVFRIAIGLDSKEFFEYVSARVTSVVASVNTRVNTPSGKFLLNLRCAADPFFDRNSQRKKLTYHSEPREKTYQYESGSMKPNFSDNGTTWSKGVNPVTPFAVWEISFPPTQLNKDISFGSTLIDLNLTFRLNALIKDAMPDAPRMMRARQGGMMMAAKMAAGTDSRPSATEVVAQMAQRGTVTNNWDVVYNMSLDKINASFTKQFDKYKADPKFSNRIKIEVRTRVKKDLYAIKKFDITYGYPSLTFLANNPNNASLTCLINGSITECTEYKTEPQECDPPITIKEETLKAIIPISKVTGVVTPSDPGSQVYSVLLNMSQGTFSADNMDLSDEEKMEFNMQLKAYFINHPVVFIINSLDLSKITTLEDLRPNQFVFKTLITQKGSQILQLFIQTGSRQVLNESQAFLNDVPEPIPATSDTSLIISSKIFFNGVLPASVQGGWKLEGTDPGTDRKAWASKFTVGSVKGTVDTSGLTRNSSSGGRGGSSTFSTTRVFMNANESNDINWSVAGMAISPTTNGTLHLAFSQLRNMPFVTKTKSTTCTILGCKDRYYSHDYSTDITVTITSAMPIALGGSGRQQTISINMSNQSVSVDGRMSGGGPCGCDDMQAQLNKAIGAQVPGQITKVLNVSFNQISMFALQNLLFPADSVITFKSVYTPGDMVVFGEFV
jgi:hypothetical protein